MQEKDIAVAFLQGVVTYNIYDVYKKYVSDGFIHHNAYYKSDKVSLLAGMVESNIQFPHKKLTVQKVITELPNVVVFAHVCSTDGMEAALVHIFRFEDNKIVEAWDISQMVPKDMVNEMSMF